MVEGEGEGEGGGATEDELRAALARERYPRSGTYDPASVLEGDAGFNALWLAESLCEHLSLEPGMRVLDLGCGYALSSIFFAREFDVAVFAVDLMIKPTDNWRRVEEAGLADRVVPLGGDARSLPFPNGFFDAVICLNSFQYFGTDDLYLRELLPLIRSGGRVGMVTAGVQREVDRAPDYFRPHWKRQFETFHDPAWWRRHWERSGLVDVEVADLVPDGWSDWLAWRELAVAHGNRLLRKLVAHDVETLRDDGGRLLGLVRAVARKLE